MSSSPLLPSPSDIFKKKPPLLGTGSRSALVPQNATASFTSAACLLSLDNLQVVDVIRPLEFGAEDADVVVPKKTSQLAKVKARKPAVQKVVGLEDGTLTKKPRNTAINEDERAINNAGSKKPRKSRTKKADGETGEGGVMEQKEQKPPCKSRGKKVDVELVVDDGTKPKAARKPRAKKGGGEMQTKLPKSRVTKPSANSEADKDGATKSNNVDSVSKHLDSTTDSIADPFMDSLDHGLVEALKRRTAWTPPPVSSAKTVSLTTPRSSENRGKGFYDLFGNFGFNNTGSKNSSKCFADGVGTRKRKLVELVRTNVSASHAAHAAKPKAPLKKAKTITGQATAAYAEKEESPVRPAPLLQYFSYETMHRNTCDQFNVHYKPRSKCSLKGGKRSSKGTMEAPILLSPESALKEVGNQDFVFGTSSQLAREQSPSFLRDLHAAMQASNKVDDPFAESSPLVAIADGGNVVSSMKRNLWSAAARDTAGSLLDIEMVDLADSPLLARHFHTSAVPKSFPSEAKPEEKEVWHDVEELGYSSSQKILHVQDIAKPVGLVEKQMGLELLGSPSRSMRHTEATSTLSTTSKISSAPKAAKMAIHMTSEPEKSNCLEKPDYASYSTVQLAKEIASYRFKPVKKRDQMIKLLEKCWEAKQRMALGVLTANIPPSSPKKSSKPLEAPAPTQVETESPKRPRGRPRKNCTTTSAVKSNDAAKTLLGEGEPPALKSLQLDSDVPPSKGRTQMPKKPQQLPIDNISDSDTPITPSPPRRRPSRIPSSPLQLQLSPAAAVDGSPKLSPLSSQLRLFKHITEAVTSAAPSKDPSNPNWHEKILLYDPIILEDLTVWLNTGALEKTGWDGEVDPKEVKKWCESKSICCLWKENLRGGTRSGH